MTEYNETYNEGLRKYSPSTTMATLLRLRPLFKELGLDGLIKGDIAGADIGEAVVTALTEANKLNEFCRIISRTNDNFLGEEMEIGTVMWLVNDFFVGLWWSMPGAWRAKMQTAIDYLIEIGKAKIGGSGGETSETTELPQSEEMKGTS